jgi:hypothetical protein
MPTATYSDILDYLGLEDAAGRHECLLCDSSDGLHVSPEQGDTGTVSCYSCGFPGYDEHGTGAGYYAACEDVPLHQALRAFGIESDAPDSEQEANTRSAIQRERQKLKRRKANTNARLKKVEQAKAKMTESERLLFRMCCNTRPNGETVTELKKAKRNDLIDRALDR